MENEFTMSTFLNAAPQEIFEAWLSSEGHTAMTGSPAKVESGVGGTFTAWDGYISGKTLDLKPYTRLVQAWRTTEFPKGSPDSRVEIILETIDGGTKLTLLHSNIPEGQADDYKKGWQEFYFDPMKEYFG
ncbi:MAG TPA: SRPBCC family protein [Anaerolineales bacterium]|jgi:activator of HSP90 ATPase|nr:SRPBCC family protein [Anaerolineales bacterium]